MATEWFIYREDERHGPFSSAEIRSLARTGELQPNDRLWKDGMRKKRRAGSSAKLFPQAVPAAKPAAGRPEPEPDFWLDDPRLVRPVFLFGGAAALLALLTALVIWFWPAGDVVDSPPALLRGGEQAAAAARGPAAASAVAGPAAGAASAVGPRGPEAADREPAARPESEPVAAALPEPKPVTTALPESEPVTAALPEPKPAAAPLPGPAVASQPAVPASPPPPDATDDF